MAKIIAVVCRSQEAARGGGAPIFIEPDPAQGGADRFFAGENIGRKRP